MIRTIKINRPASGSGTVVTVTLKQNGISVSFAYRTVGTSIRTGIRVATENCESMLTQALEEVEASS